MKISNALQNSGSKKTHFECNEGIIFVINQTCGRGAGIHGDVLNVHAETFWMDTRRGSSPILLTKKGPRRVIT